jgi:hypothetical protein
VKGVIWHIPMRCLVCAVLLGDLLPGHTQYLI